jgi:hypothetical protein
MPMEASEEPQTSTPQPAATTMPPHPGQSRWRLALIMVSSAALSGIAVVLWNRRALQHMRESSITTGRAAQTAAGNDWQAAQEPDQKALWNEGYERGTAKAKAQAKAQAKAKLDEFI